MYRSLFALLLLAGCGSGVQGWTLILDRAQLAPADEQGKPWCVDGSVPTVSATVTVGSVSSSSDELASTLQPSWGESLLYAGGSWFARGTQLEIFGRCAPSPKRFSIGAKTVPLPRDALEAVEVVFQRFGGVQDARMHFIPDYGDAATYDPGYYDPGYYDPGYDDPGYWGDSGYWDDTSGYDNSGDVGSDPGADDSGSDDSGDDTGDSKILPRPVRARSLHQPARIR